MVAKTEKSQAMIEKILSTASQLFIHNGYEKGRFITIFNQKMKFFLQF